MGFKHMGELLQRSFNEVNSTNSFFSKTKSRTTIFDNVSEN